MDITIDIDAPTPLFTQLVEQIKHGVQSGQLQPGMALPSIRQLANDLSINNKTVAKAYKLLERDCVIETKGYRGTYIHQDAVNNCHCNIDEQIEEILNNALEQLKNVGATDSEIRIAFSNLMNQRTDRG